MEVIDPKIIDVYQSETDTYKKMKIIGKYRYLGGLNQIDLVKGKIYYRVGNKDEFRIVDDSEEDYLYPSEYFKEIIEKNNW